MVCQYNGGSFTPEEAYGVIAGLAPKLPTPKIRGFTDEEWVFLNPFATSMTSQDVHLETNEPASQQPTCSVHNPGENCAYVLCIM